VMPIPSTTGRKRPQFRVPGANLPLAGNSAGKDRPPREAKADPILSLLGKIDRMGSWQLNMARSVLIDMKVVMKLMLEVGEPLKALYELQENGHQIIWGANDLTSQEWLDVSGASGLVEIASVFLGLELPRGFHGERAEGWGMRFHQKCTIPFRTFMIDECAKFKVTGEQLLEDNV
jgi:hypothetical protein